MLNRTRLALVAGALGVALVGAGCSNDGADRATGPSNPAAVVPNGHGRATSVAPRGDDGQIIDRAVSPFSFTSPDGHLFEVRFAVDANGDVTTSQHLRDGQVFVVAGEGGTTTSDQALSIYSGGALISSQLILASDLAAPAARMLPNGPVATQYIGPCDAEWAAYFQKSAELIAAGMAYVEAPTQYNSLRLARAATAWAVAWRNLLKCKRANPV